MKLSLQYDDNVIELTSVENSLSRYQLRGLSVGVVSVTARSVQRGGAVIQSRPQRIHVFAPLQVTPSDLVLVPHSYFQVASLSCSFTAELSTQHATEPLCSFSG